VDPAELTRSQQNVKSLQKQNDLLTVSLENEQSKATPAVETNALEEARRALAKASLELAEQKSQTATVTLERDTLEARLKALGLATNTPPPQGSASAQAQESDYLNRIRQLEQDRDDLRQKLQAAQKESPEAGPARIAELESQVASLRTRLETYEARQVPYTSEELALFKKPEARLPESVVKPRSIQELAPATANLVVEARRYFLAGQFDQAEAAYVQAAQQNNTNVSVLANLAAVQVERKRFDAAEESLKQALAISPNDAYSLFVLGNLKFRQAKYDEALDALSRAAKLDPQNAEVQNFLGLTLSEKGMRIPAETALRKAVEIDPSYASAHNNLAVVYITQQPPAVELARLHYQKALAAGAPRNAELEKLIEEKAKSQPK
jgi:tetratricopeptide (TPR) repeat protein